MKTEDKMTSNLIDLDARRQAAFRARLERLAQYEADEDLRKDINAALYTFEERLHREREQRQKYEAAIAAKRGVLAL
jgi:hypothetical protein